MAVRPLIAGGIIIGLAAAACGADDSWYPAQDLQLEAHGFASFGYLQTWGNNWLGDTIGGTTQFWEAATNVVARPFDRVRVGAQLYARDLVNYDHGQVRLDWAYLDWRAADAFGVQIGRVKVPLGLYNENIDVDVARASVFMPVDFYSLIDRDLYLSIDGAKLYGHLELGSLGSGEYAFSAGRKPLHSDGSFATHYSEQNGIGSQVEGVSVSWAAGGMVQWNTPLNGLSLRASLGDLHDFCFTGASTTTGLVTQSAVDNYWEGILSAQYEVGRMTFAAEYQRLRGRGNTEVQPIGIDLPLVDNAEYAYLSATWHALRWLELYGACELSFDDANHPSASHSYTGVFAFNVMPLPNWSLKAEFREVEGTFGIFATDNPGGIASHWQVLALKTTVDF